ncbi:MAG: GAF domain-containing protein [Ahrensia sp.]|nr:GAF domain-containing protein [Ahrensia sp.]
MTMTQAELAAEAIKGCDREPIHAPGYIQPCGFLMALDDGCNTFTHMSENVGPNLGGETRELLSVRPRDLLPKALIHDINNFRSRSTSTRQREMIGDIETGEGTRKVTAHVRDNTTILEVVGLGDIPISQSEGLDRLRWLTQRFDHHASLNDILSDAVKSLRAFSGYDRVMAYRFRPDGSGEVVAEDKVSDVDGYLGLRFPEFDVPEQARKLYVQTPIRMISDVDANTIGLMAQPDAGDLDMSLAILRGTMPVHNLYLRNMGVRGSLSLPIAIDGKLWGLFAFHHRSPRYLGAGVSLALEFSGQYLNLVIRSALKDEQRRCEVRAVQVANSLFSRRENVKASQISWSLVKDNLLNMMPASGVAFVDAEGARRHGQCPSQEALPKVVEALKPVNEQIAISDNLAEHVDKDLLGGVAGALQIQLGKKSSAQSNPSILFFRGEAATQVSWAGSPDKSVDMSADTPRLSPRGSFSAFTVEMTGRSEAWEPSDIAVAEGLYQAAQRSYAEAADRDALLENLELLVQELNHRVRNILALVKSIIQQTRPDEEEQAAIYKDLEARILSLATAHNALTQNNARMLDLRDALERAASPYARRQVRLEGPKVGIVAEAGSVFVLVLHELFSNAAKYGALLTEQGRVDINWQLDASGVRLYWREFGGPPVSEPERFGFGQTLVRNALSFEFEGDAQVEFRPEGVYVSMFVPKNVLVMEESDPPPRVKFEVEPLVAMPEKPLSGTILVLEDDFLIASQLQCDAESLGAEEVLMASSVSQAMDCLDSRDIEFAFIDVNLKGGRSLPVAEHLKLQDTPFVFVTGYSGGEAQLSAFEHVPVVRKPFQLSDMIAAISSCKS